MLSPDEVTEAHELIQLIDELRSYKATGRLGSFYDASPNLAALMGEEAQKNVDVLFRAAIVAEIDKLIADAIARLMDLDVDTRGIAADDKIMSAVGGRENEALLS